MKATANTPVVYILGAGHSGSTLLAMLLGSHPDVCTIGEVKGLAAINGATYRCSCGRILNDCLFWQQLADELRACSPPFDLLGGPSDIRYPAGAYLRRLLEPLHRGPLLERLRDWGLSLSPSWREHAGRVRAFTTAVSRGACKLSHKRVFVDSSKTGLHFKSLIGNPDLDVKAIRLVRDARGVSLSYKKADGLQIKDAAFEWRRSNEEASLVVMQLEESRWLDLRYEDLCRDVDGTLERVFAFIGVDIRTSASLLTSGIQHVLGNDRMRLNSGEVRLDEKWRRELSAGELDVIDALAGHLNRSLGYK